MRLGFVLFVGLALVACSDDTRVGDDVSTNTGTDLGAAPRPKTGQPPQPRVGPPAPIGGQPLTGSVSALTGIVTGFEVRRTDTQTIVDLAADVLFDFDSASLSAGAPEKLARAAELIRQGGAGLVTVIGHTDATGEDKYNEGLSLGRAKAVAAWLSGPGNVRADRLVPVGRGETEPIAPKTGADGEDDPAGRAKNRRVSIAIPR